VQRAKRYVQTLRRDLTVQTVVHPTYPALERIRLLVPDRWNVTHYEGDSGNILPLMREEGVFALQLSLVSYLYQPGMLPPHLLEIAEHYASINHGQTFGRRIWRRVPKGWEDAPMDQTGARSPDDVVTGTLGSIGRRLRPILLYSSAPRSSARPTYATVLIDPAKSRKPHRS
jgi:hypothetical protein